jgi:hypothetical protein
MRSKVRELVQHGGPPGWLEGSDPAGVIWYVMYGPYHSLFLTVPVALTGASQLRARCELRPIFSRDETGLVYLPTQLERTLQLYR